MRRKVFGDIQVLGLELVRRVGLEVKRQDGEGQEVIAGGVGKMQRLVEGEILVLVGGGKILPLLIATKGEAPIFDM